MQPTEENFAAMIAGLLDQGLTQSDIAHLSGVSEATVSRLKSGEVRAPGYATVVRIKNVGESVRLPPMQGKQL